MPMLEKHSEGLIVTTACIGGHIPTLLREGNIEEAEERTEWFMKIYLARPILSLKYHPEPT